MADAVLDTSPYGGSATVDRPGTLGLSTRVEVDRDGTFTSAWGWLGSPHPGDRYPVLSAKDAFAQLPALAHPDICQVAPGGKGCVQPAPAVITGAALGLSLQPLADGGAVLVPSWLFALKGGGTAVAIAVQPMYLPTPSPASTPRMLVPGTTKAPSPNGAGASSSS